METQKHDHLPPEQQQSDRTDYLARDSGIKNLSSISNLSGGTNSCASPRTFIHDRSRDHIGVITLITTIKLRISRGCRKTAEGSRVLLMLDASNCEVCGTHATVDQSSLEGLRTSVFAATR
ncbi:unnamed protein product [Hermetia illucens]|uniref:Uncharacterized protein n=1 Tax=Hermetia illucens TaxID=343691 RepID=A0A7R8YL15_HERIL|nr:unnamed protein product [Hermetia illucens]